MKLFCASSTSFRFTEGELYDAEFNGMQFRINDDAGNAWRGLYEDESGFIVVSMVGGDFVEFE